MVLRWVKSKVVYKIMLFHKCVHEQLPDCGKGPRRQNGLEWWYFLWLRALKSQSPSGVLGHSPRMSHAVKCRLEESVVLWDAFSALSASSCCLVWRARLGWPGGNQEHHPWVLLGWEKPQAPEEPSWHLSCDLPWGRSLGRRLME